MAAESVQLAPLKSPAINVLIGKTSSGKSSRLAEWLINYSKLHQRNFEKITLVYGPSQENFYNALILRLEPSVHIVKRHELKPEYFTREVLRSERGGHAILVLGKPVRMYLCRWYYCPTFRRPNSESARCQGFIRVTSVSVGDRARAPQRRLSLRHSPSIEFQ